jgi:secondary thiamine-phosphate synthase enzyme
MLRQHLQILQVATSGEGFTDLTDPLNAVVAASGLQLGLLNLVCLHTSCSLTINENADPRVLADLAAHLRALVPEEGIRPVSGLGALRPYVHADEGSDDMPAHVRTALTASQLSLSFQDGRLLLGTWQAIYLWEHRRRGSRRQLSVHVLGS